jgi:predicted Zn-dependent protease
MTLEKVAQQFRELARAIPRWSIRVVRSRTEELSIQRAVAQPLRIGEDLGAMVTVVEGGGIGYAATPDLSREGLERAAIEARLWANRAGRCFVFDPQGLPRLSRGGTYESPVRTPWESVSLAERTAMLRAESEGLRCDARIVDWEAALAVSEVESLLADSDGAEIRQLFRYVVPTLRATAARPGDSETRTFGGHAFSRQGGLEVLEAIGWFGAGRRVGEEALELLSAPRCPAGVMDLVLAPDQAILQVHESIGHALELDRILGDERNYAGRSFVKPEMFGRYRYGSPLLNVTFDPTVPGEFASYGFDDEGSPAAREYLIREGLLVRALGGATSRARCGVPGVACTRASGWNRPPVDRMGNVNLEPGSSTFEELVRAVERGVYMETNCSWSIDDAREKFQFGCERGRRIVDGELREVVRRPGYRGVTPIFWHSLAAVGDPSTRLVLGTPYCGKGEPNQAIPVGHAAPACLFRGVEVFGDERQ